MRTAHKILLARMMASALIGAGLNPIRRSVRSNLAWELDLREGVDLSLFLFGSFQRHVTSLARQVVPRDGIVIDIGANIGAITLPLAAWLREGHVYAVEPTDYALRKLRMNLSLNHEVASRVTVIESFLADSKAERSDLIAYSSWPLAGSGAAGSELHPVHRGAPMSSRCGQMTLDELVASLGLERADFIKIDTDGHEFAVLSGASRTLSELRPVISFEACEYLMRPPRPVFEDFEALFDTLDYTICKLPRLRRLTAERFRVDCPAGGSLDLVAAPNERAIGVRSKV